MAIWLLVILISCVYLTRKYKLGYVYAFCLWYPILPTAFGIRVAESLPILSVSRLLLLLLIMMYCIEHGMKLILRKDGIFGSLYLKFGALLIIISSVFNVVLGKSSANDLLNIVLEQIFLIVILFSIIRKINCFKRCLEMLCYGGLLLWIIGIVQSITGFNAAECLFELNREMYIELAPRLGLMRASATMNAITYGYYCVALSPIILYLYRTTKQKKYFYFLLLDLLAILFSITRGAAVMFAFILVLDMFFCRKKTISYTVVKNGLIIIGVLTVLCIIVVNCYPNLVTRVMQILEVTMNVFNNEYSIATVDNNNAVNSRLVQLSIFDLLVKKDQLLLGLGSFDKEIYYYIKGAWVKSGTVDVGITSMALSGGVLRVIGYYVIFISCFVKVCSKFMKYKKDLLKLMVLELSSFFLISNISSVFYKENGCVIIWAIVMIALFGKMEEKYIE